MNQPTLAIFKGKPVRSNPFPFRGAFGELEKKSLLECLDHYAKLNEDPPYQGFFETKFCREFSEYMGGGFSDAVSTGTAAIFVALQALELPNGSEVLISPVTDSGPLNCIILQNLVPVVVDAAPGSYNVKWEQVLARITPKTKAFLAVHSAGEPLEIDLITAELHKRGIKVLEDCSQAPGAMCNGRKVGAWGDIAAFSTMYRKTLQTGGSGGLVFSKNEAIFKKALSYSDRGKPVWRTDIDLRNPEFSAFPALNFNTNELSCAIGSASLARLESAVVGRVKFLEMFVPRLKSVSSICKPYALHAGFSPFYFPIFVDTSRITCTKFEFAEAVRAEGIPLGSHYGCLISSWPWAHEYMSDSFRTINALDTQAKSFNLYVNERYEKNEVDDIVSAIVKVETYYAK